MAKYRSTKVVEAYEFIPGLGNKYPVEIMRKGDRYYRLSSKGPEWIKPHDFIVKAFGSTYRFVDHDTFMRQNELIIEQ